MTASIIEDYIVLGGLEFLNMHAQTLAKILDLVVGNVNAKRSTFNSSTCGCFGSDKYPDSMMQLLFCITFVIFIFVCFILSKSTNYYNSGPRKVFLLIGVLFIFHFSLSAFELFFIFFFLIKIIHLLLWCSVFLLKCRN